MRRQLVSLTFAALAILPPVIAAAPAVGEEPQSGPAVAVQRLTPFTTGMRDEALMVLVGTALIALGAAVRRAA